MAYIPEPSEEELLASIRPDMKLNKSLFKRIYGYGITNPSFPDKAISALESAGCSKARTYYENWVAEYQAAHDKELKEVARWYKRECEREFEKLKKGRESNADRGKAPVSDGLPQDW